MSAPIRPDEVDLGALDGLLSFFLRTLGPAVSRDLDEQLDGLEVARGTGKISTLLLVARHPGIRPSLIAQMMFKDRAATGRLIETMEQQGLLQRRVDAEDNRALGLFITPYGEQLAQRVSRLISEQDRQFFHDVSDQELDTVLAVLRKVYRRLAGYQG